MIIISPINIKLYSISMRNNNNCLAENISEVLLELLLYQKSTNLKYNTSTIFQNYSNPISPSIHIFSN